MTNPFAGPITIMAVNMRGCEIKDCVRCSAIRAAIRVLETAGAMDKKRALRVLATLLRVYVEADGILIPELEEALTGGAVREIRALLEAIPDGDGK
ncbi:MAG: hypothetical protein IMZ62_16015 [Chloroflexi bacterium]|nr:hypothetical protein [Chloroflexota bacterium]